MQTHISAFTVNTPAPGEAETLYLEGATQSLAKCLATLHPLVRVKIQVPRAAHIAAKTPGSDWQPPDARPSDNLTWDELFAPLYEDFLASGMTDNELGELIDSEIAGYRAERRAKDNAA